LAEKGEKDQALDDFTKALEINPRFAEAYYIGELFMRVKSTWSGNLRLHDGSQDKTKIWWGLHQSGECLFGEGAIWSGDLRFHQGYWAKPGDDAAYYNRGVAYAAKGQYDQTISDCSKAMR